MTPPNQEKLEKAGDFNQETLTEEQKKAMDVARLKSEAEKAAESSNKDLEVVYLENCNLNLKYKKNAEFKNNLTQEKYMNKFDLDQDNLLQKNENTLRYPNCGKKQFFNFEDI